MKRVMVKFDQAEQIINFVRIICRYDYDADVRCGSRIVDAKSVVGVLSLAKSKTDTGRRRYAAGLLVIAQASGFGHVVGRISGGQAISGNRRQNNSGSAYSTL